MISDSATILRSSQPAPTGARSSRSSWSNGLRCGGCTPRLAYLHDCLTALDADLRRRSGTGRVVRHGDPVSVISRLAAELGVEEVFVSRDYAPYGRRRDAAVAESLRRDECSSRGVGSPYAVAPGGVRKGDGDPYAVFTPFSKVWRQVGWDAPVDAPGDDFRWLGSGAVASESWPERPEPAAGQPGGEPLRAGEAAAHERWSEFLHEALDEYDEHRDQAGSRRNEPPVAGAEVGHDPSPATARRPRCVRRRAACLDTVYSSELAWEDFYADVLFQRPETVWGYPTRKMEAMPVDTDAAALYVVRSLGSGGDRFRDRRRRDEAVARDRLECTTGSA